MDTKYDVRYLLIEGVTRDGVYTERLASHSSFDTKEEAMIELRAIVFKKIREINTVPIYSELGNSVILKYNDEMFTFLSVEYR